MGTVRRALLRSGRHRGFTLLEVGIAAAMFMTVLGVVAVSSARAQYAAQSARSLSYLVGEVDFLLGDISPEDLGPSSLVRVPSPCSHDESRSCITVFGQPAEVSWTVVPGSSWSSTGYSAPSATVFGRATGGRDLEVTRSREVSIPHSGRLVRLVPSGNLDYQGPVFVYSEAQGEVLVSSEGLPVGAVVGPYGSVVLEVPEGSCLGAGDCRLALSPDGSTVSADVALTHRSVGRPLVVSAAGVSEHSFEVSPRSPFSVLVESVLPDGGRAYPAVAGTVCLHLAALREGSWVELSSACNGPDPRLVVFEELEVSGLGAAVTPGEALVVSASHIDAGSPCSSGAGRLVPTSSGWVQAPEDTELPCSASLWGEPSGVRLSPDSAVRVGEFTFVAAGGLPVLSWEDAPDAGASSGVRVTAPWSAPLDCEFPCEDPQASVLPALPFLDSPSLGVMGVPAVSLPSGDTLEVTLTVFSPSGSPSLELVSVVGDVTVEFKDETLRDEFDADPEQDPDTEPPPVWFPLGEGGSVTAGSFGPAGEVTLRLAAGSGSIPRALLWDVGAPESSVLFLPSSGDPLVDVIAPMPSVRQGSSLAVPVFLVSDSGELVGLPAGIFAQDPSGSVVLSGAGGGSPLLEVGAHEAGRVDVELDEALLPSVLGVPDLPVQVVPRPGSVALSSTIPSQMLQGTVSPFSVTLTDIAGEPLPGWPVWFWAEDEYGSFVRHISASEVSCVTGSPTGACLLQLKAVSSAPAGSFSVRAAAGWSPSVASSSAHAVSVLANPSGVFVDGVVVSPGGSASARATVLTAPQAPVVGAMLQMVSQATFLAEDSVSSAVPLPAGSVSLVADLASCPEDATICISFSGPSDSEGFAFVDLVVASGADAGIYTIPVGSGASSSASSAPWKVTVAPLTATAEVGAGVFVAPGGSILVPVTLREPLGTPARGRAVAAASSTPGVRAEVVGLSDSEGKVDLALEVASDFEVPASGVVQLDLLVEGVPLGSSVNVPVREAAVEAILSGAAYRDAVSSQLRISLRGSDGAPLGERAARVELPSGLELLTAEGGCGEGLLCFDAESELTLEVVVSGPAPSSGVLLLTVDGVRLELMVQVVG